MSQISELLRDRGFLWDLGWDEAASLPNYSQEVQAAAYRYMQFAGQAEIWRQALDARRATNVAGNILLANLKADSMLCPLPDVTPPPTAVFHYEDRDVQEAVVSMQLAAEAAKSGRGSWPVGCYPDILPNRHVVKVFFNRDSMSRSWQAVWDRIQQLVIEAGKRRGVLLHPVSTARGANVEVQHRNGNGWIGLAQFNQQRCSDTPFCYVDTRWNPSDLVNGAAQLVMHEIGHTLNLPHTSRDDRRDVMSAMLSWRTEGFVGFADDDRSTATLKRFFGDEPIELQPPPGPQPPPGDWKTLIEFAEGQYRLQEKQGGGGGGWGPV